MNGFSTTEGTEATEKPVCAPEGRAADSPGCSGAAANPGLTEIPTSPARASRKRRFWSPLRGSDVFSLDPGFALVPRATPWAVRRLPLRGKNQRQGGHR